MTPAVAVRVVLSAVLVLISFAIVYDAPPPSAAWLSPMAAFLAGYFFAEAERRVVL